MATEALFNLHRTSAELRAAYANLMRLKVDSTEGLSEVQADALVLAAWGNLHDDAVLALVDTVGRIYTGDNDPTDAVSAPSGSVYLRSSGEVYRKTDDGVAGWEQLGGAVEANSLALDRLTTIATDNLLGRATAGTGDVELVPCTAAGRALLGDASAAEQRTTLGAAASGAIASSGLTIATSRLAGRTTASSGALEEIAVGSGLSLSSGTLSATAIGDTDVIAAGGVVVLARSAQALSVADTTAETDVISYSVTAGLLSTNRVIRVRCLFSYVNSSGSARQYTWRAYLGGTVLYEDNSASNGSSALVMAGEFEFLIGAESATTVRAGGFYRQHTTNAPNVGLGALDQPSARIDAPILSGDDAITVPDLTAATRTLQFTIQHPAATTLQRWRRQLYTVELLP